MAAGDNLLIGDAVAQTPPQALQIIYGNAVVVDGDTLRMGDVHLRLIGIDAPEADQMCAAAGGGTWRCGEAAIAALEELAAAGVWCGWQTFDQYGQGLATCITRGANSIYINEWMVETGNAWTYLMDEYAAAEGRARAAGVGVWQAPTPTAAEYRRAQDAAISAGQQTTRSGVRARGQHQRRRPHLSPGVPVRDGDPGCASERWF